MDIFQISAFAGAIATIIGLARLVVNPFQKAIAKNDATMRNLQDTIQNLMFELKESKQDRDQIHKVLDKHEERIGKNEDAIIINNERIATLFKKEN